MNYNINDILPFVKDYTIPEYFSSSEEDDLISSIKGEDYDWEDGATKLVIIPDNLDYVIKIPFNSKKRIEYDEEEEYTDFCYDYCIVEVELYQQIEENYPEFLQFFLPLTKIVEFEDYDVYIQPKCQTYLNSTQKDIVSSYSEDTMTKVKKSLKNRVSRTMLPLNWIAAITEVLQNVELVERFFDMLDEFDISRDLHRGNIGYKDGKPVILDYGSYYE